ncbi:NAD-dependent epimerase/dehydratase family protein, partial [Acinetobacter baumannii]
IDTVVLDDMNSGRPSFVPDGIPIVHGSITDPAAVAEVVSADLIEGVVHVAALKYAGVSVKEPLDSFRVNVEGTRILLEQCVAAG